MKSGSQYLVELKLMHVEAGYEVQAWLKRTFVPSICAGKPWTDRKAPHSRQSKLRSANGMVRTSWPGWG